MKFMVTFQMQGEKANAALRDRNFGEKMQQLLNDFHAESVYFSTINGERGCHMVLNLDDPSMIPKIAEPLFFWLGAKVNFYPVMTPEDLQKATGYIKDSADKWSD